MNTLSTSAFRFCKFHYFFFNVIIYKDNSFHYGSTVLPAYPKDGVIKLRLLLDKASLEMFANEGEAVSTDYAVAKADNYSFGLSSHEEIFINELTINSLSSAWQ